jgi:glycosyl hydrolase family 113
VRTPTPSGLSRALLLTLGTLGAGCGGSSSPAPQPTQPGASPTPSGGTASGFTHKALTHVSWWHDEYLGSAAGDARRALVTTHANWAGVLATWYMDRPDSSTFAPDSSQTPTDAAVVHAIQDFHGLGLKVMLKPHVDVRDGSWRGNIRPTDVGAWFASYDAFMSHYASLAQANGVDLLDVGTELVTMTDSRNASSWDAIIGHVRSLFRGPLTYSANANAAGDEFTSVSFWSLLDFAGLDVYPPLTNHDNPTSAELIQAWSGNVNGDDMLAAYRNWQAGHGKPVLFTEIGYRSMAGANRAPWDFTRQGPASGAEQANCYDAAFTVWSRESAWLKGMFWWAWPATVPGPGDTDYTPRGKPAEDVLQRWYAL